MNHNRQRKTKNITLTHTQWDMLYSIIESRADGLEAKIKKETNPTKLFEMKMERSDLEELLFLV